MRKFFCGPESFTPDLQPIVGEAPELRNYFVAAGLNSIGILTGGGLGRVMAHWIINGRARRRRHRHEHRPAAPLPGATRSTGATRTVESLGMVYKCHYPTHTMKTARGARRSPFHDRLAAQRRVLPRRQRLGDRRAGTRRAGTSPIPGELTWGRPTWWPTGRPSTAPRART